MKRLLILLLAGYLIFDQTYASPPVQFGVTFSPRYAKYLQLNWQETFRRMLNEIKVKNLRLPLYWEDIEIKEDEYNFSDADFMLSLSKEAGVKVIAVLGIRQPRWPECHLPPWARQLSVTDRQNKALQFIKQVVQRYEGGNGQIWAWQVENEPFLPFGDNCDKQDENFLKREIETVRNLSNKPLILTDSGELGFWVETMKLSDIFGTTLYRQVYDKSFGYITYPVPPYFYSLKSHLIRSMFAPRNLRTIIVESQAEPWLADGSFIEPDKQAKLFTMQNFKAYVNFAQKTGFREIYLWGIEWWYAMAQNGYPEYLDYAKELFK